MAHCVATPLSFKVSSYEYTYIEKSSKWYEQNERDINKEKEIIQSR
jgi:hypothetical protein